MKKALRWIGISLGLVIAVLLVVWAIMNAVWGAELRKTIAGIKAHGEPMTIAEIVPPAVSPDKNAVVELNKAFVLMSGDKPDEQYIPGKQSGKLKANVQTLNDFQSKMSQSSTEERKKIFDLIDSPEFAEIFDRLNAAALKSGYNQDLKYEDGIAMLISNFGVFRTSVRLLCLKALAQANKGNMAGACDTLMTAIKVSNHLQNEPILISQLVRVACLGMILEALNNISDNFQLPEKDAPNLIAELDKINTTERLKKSLIAERVVFGGTIFDRFISGKYGYEYARGISPNAVSRLLYFIFWKPFIKRDYCEYLRIMFFYPKVCDKPYYSSKEELERIGMDIDHIPFYCQLSRMLVPSLTTIFERNAELQTKLAISKIKLALVIYKGNNPTFPESLEQLQPGILREIPIDELTGTPLTYKREGDKYVLFSAAVQKLEEERKLEREKNEREQEAQRKKAAGK